MCGKTEKLSALGFYFLHLPSSHRVPRQGFTQKSFPDQAFPGPHCEDVDNRLIYGPSAFGHSKAFWSGIVAAPTKGSLTREIQRASKGLNGRRTRLKPPSCPLRINAFEARYWAISLQLQAESEPHTEDANGSVDPAEETWQGNSTSPGTQQ